MAITIVFGAPRIGKTAFLAKIGADAMFDKARYLQTVSAVGKKQAGGFGVTVPPKHCVYVNFELIGRKWRYRPRRAWHLIPEKLGYYDPSKPFEWRHFFPPYSILIVTESQDIFDGRNFKNFTREQSAIFEQHGHNYYDIYMDAQRHDLVDKNIRNIANFIQIMSKETVIGKFGIVLGTKWVIRRFNSYKELDQHIATGEKTYTEETVTCDFDVHECYNSQMMEPRFYEGNFDRDYCQDVVRAPEQTKDAYIQYLQERRK